MLQRKFLSNLLLLLFLNLMVKPFWVFAIDVNVQNAVGAADYGLYFAIFNFAFLFNILLDMGINNFNNRNIARHNKMILKHFPRIIVLKFLLGILYLTVTFTTAYFTGFDSLRFKFLLFVAFNQFLLSFLLYLRSNISGLLLFRIDSILSVLDRLLMILFVGVLLWVDFGQGKFQIMWFVWAQTAAYLISVIIAFAVVAKHSKFQKPKWDFVFFRLIIKKSFPYALLILLMTVYARVDSVLLDRLLPDGVGNTEAGIYANAYRLLDAANQMAYLFAVILLPAFSYLIKQNESVKDLTRITFNVLFVVSVTLAAVSFFFNEEIMLALYPQGEGESPEAFRHRLNEAVRIFPLLMTSFAGYASTYVFGTLLTAQGALKQLILVAAAGVVISIVINVLLIPDLLAAGSAYANLTAQFITAALQIYLAYRYFRFPFNMKYLGALVSFVLLTFVFFYLTEYIDSLWYWKILYGILAAVVLSIVLRILNIKEFYIIFANKEANV